MVNRRRERKKGGRSKENDSHDFLLFQKEMDGVVK